MPKRRRLEPEPVADRWAQEAVEVDQENKEMVKEIPLLLQRAAACDLVFQRLPAQPPKL